MDIPAIRPLERSDPVIAPAVKPSATAVAFEAAMLRTFVETMLPKEGFGEGTAGHMWRSQMADALATKLAEGGGVGLAAMIEPAAGTTR